MKRKSEVNSHYLNRELSWLAFNERVLEEATDERNPLLERVKFLAIAANNLDEFFEIQIASLLQRVEEGQNDPGPDGLMPGEQLRLIQPAAHESIDAQYRCWNKVLLPALAAAGIRILPFEKLSQRHRSFIEEYYGREIDPLLTPVTIDPAHPFPRVINKAFCLALLLRKKRKTSSTFMGVVTVPRVLPRLVRLPSEEGTAEFVFLADIVREHATRMYRGYDVLSTAAFRVTRNSNLYLEEEESRNLLESVHSELANRRKGDAVRLEIDDDADAAIIERLQQNFELEDWQVFRNDGPVNLTRIMNVYEQVNRPDLKFRPYVPRELRLPPATPDFFAHLRHQDVLLHHPYDSYEGVVDFIESATKDPRVRSIKLTLYRTSEDSPIIRALIDAAASKEVTVVVEVKARFDEASNIKWARNLEDAGVQVFHGLVGLKTHCKMCLLVRQDPDGVIRRYAHIGTGNYNPVTARYYTDLSLLTCDPEITAAAHNIFNYLTAHAQASSYAPLAVAPLNLSSRLLQMIQREAEHARAKRPAGIIAKMNALTDPVVIEALYRASQAGVKIDLIVRGMCSLRPGIAGVSDNIRVRSIVGRFLEHSRIFHFTNGGSEELFMASADWMPRNLYDRVEIMTPLRAPEICKRVRQEILEAYLQDNLKARVMAADGTYTRPERHAKGKSAPGVNAQELLMQLAGEERSAPAAEAAAPAEDRTVTVA